MIYFYIITFDFIVLTDAWIWLKEAIHFITIKANVKVINNYEQSIFMNNILPLGRLQNFDILLV